MVRTLPSQGRNVKFESYCGDHSRTTYIDPYHMSWRYGCRMLDLLYILKYIEQKTLPVKVFYSKYVFTYLLF